MNKNSFGSESTLNVGSNQYRFYSLEALEKGRIASTSRIPYSIKILLENLLRFEDGRTVKSADIEYVAKWKKGATAKEINFRPARVLLQDFTGVPCVVDLAAMRDALRDMGADPEACQSADPRRPGDRPFGASGQVRLEGRLQLQRAARIPAQSGALRVSALGPESLSGFPRGSARYRHLPPGESGVPGFGDLHRSQPLAGAGLSRHAGGHRFAHHHDQRTGRGGLGRGRHRGRGLHARPADFDAAARGGGIQD